LAHTVGALGAVPKRSSINENRKANQEKADRSVFDLSTVSDLTERF